MLHLHKTFLTLVFAWFASIQIAYADADSDIAFILQAQKPPSGVVFEVVEGDEEKLETALNQINGYIKQLKSKLPAMKIAVVSHGSEQFALLSDNQQEFSATHTKVQSLVSNDVPVHVCGTHASWRGFTGKDFPSYVDVAVAGPAKIREYQRQGYALVEVDIP